MAKRILGFLREHTLAAGFTAALVALALLMGLQIAGQWRIHQLTAMAHRAVLLGYLEAVGKHIQEFYRTRALWALDLPPSVFVEQRLEKVAARWAKKPIPGVRRLFLVDYTEEPFGRFGVFDPESGTLERPPASDESLAMIVATASWQMLSLRGGTAEDPGVVVDERNPEHRMMLRPVVDDSSRVVGVLGMILDEAWFRSNLLPEAIEAPLEEFFPKAGKGDLVVRVRDGKGRPVLVVGGADALPSAADARIPFVFGDWTVELHLAHAAPAEWARGGFWFNLGVSGMLALSLVGGLLLALRAANRAVRLSAMKSDFVSNVSHELRTPVASIRALAELLRHGRTTTPEKVREYGGYIEAESRRLSRLIENILDFSRIESGRKVYRFTRARVEDVVEGLVETFGVRLRAQGFEVVYEPPREDPGETEIDPDAIGQAVYNLIDNAVKYSGESKRVEIAVSRSGGEIAISVRDRGIGIPRDEQKRIFDRFHRVGSSLVHDVKGAGLGLAIVHHVLQAHHGRVTVESEPGGGSTFTLWIPVGDGSRRSSGPVVEPAGSVE